MTGLSDSFFGRHANLTDEQLAAIGRVAARWSLLEFMLESAIVGLAMAPNLPGLALTNDLGIDNRLKALRNLIHMHRARYREKLCPKEALDALEPLPREIARLKDRRNKIIHYVWFRTHDEKLVGIRFAGKHMGGTGAPPPGHKQHDGEEAAESSLSMTLARMRRVAEEIDEVASKLYQAIPLLPNVDEDQLAEWLPRAGRRPRSDTR